MTLPIQLFYIDTTYSLFFVECGTYSSSFNETSALASDCPNSKVSYILSTTMSPHTYCSCLFELVTNIFIILVFQVISIVYHG